MQEKGIWSMECSLSISTAIHYQMCRRVKNNLYFLYMELHRYKCIPHNVCTKSLRDHLCCILHMKKDHLCYIFKYDTGPIGSTAHVRDNVAIKSLRTNLMLTL